MVHAQVPNSAARTYVERGNERFAKKDIKGALADFDIAITFDPGYASAYYNRARVLSIVYGRVNDVFALMRSSVSVTDLDLSKISWFFLCRSTVAAVATFTDS